VPVKANHGTTYFSNSKLGTYRDAMILLLVTNLVILVGESCEIFHNSKVRMTFNRFKRVTALIIAFPLFLATLIVTVKSHGKELVWLIWLTISISLTAA